MRTMTPVESKPGNAHLVSHKRVLTIAAVAFALVGFVLIFHSLDPTQFRFFPRCWLYSSTGLHCPGCGGQRAVHALLNGDLMAALRFNLMLMIALPIGLWFGGQEIHRRIRRLPPRLPRGESTRNIWIFFLFLVLFSVLRNIPVAPFKLLAP